MNSDRGAWQRQFAFTCEDEPQQSANLLRPELTDPASVDQPALDASNSSGARLLRFAEPPSADPHARWCGEGAR